MIRHSSNQFFFAFFSTSFARFFSLYLLVTNCIEYYIYCSVLVVIIVFLSLDLAQWRFNWFCRWLKYKFSIFIKILYEMRNAKWTSVTDLKLCFFFFSSLLFFLILLTLLSFLSTLFHISLHFLIVSISCTVYSEKIYCPPKQGANNWRYTSILIRQRWIYRMLSAIIRT